MEWVRMWGPTSHLTPVTISHPPLHHILTPVYNALNKGCYLTEMQCNATFNYFPLLLTSNVLYITKICTYVLDIELLMFIHGEA